MKNTILNKKYVFTGLLLCVMLSQQANAAIALDRTRAIFNGDVKSISLNISNQNKTLPYLAQAWIEDDKNNKIESPMVILPPVQRIEPGKPSQVKVEALPGISQLPQDRETLYYFNLREIPPRSDKANTLQIALQTRIKLFYRPTAILPSKADLANAPWQEKLTLTKQGDKYQVNNPTPYYVTIVGASSNKNSKDKKDFIPVMIEPKGQAMLGVNANDLGSKPVLTYINDYGGRPQLSFSCTGNTCLVVTDKSAK